MGEKEEKNAVAQEDGQDTGNAADIYRNQVKEAKIKLKFQIQVLIGLSFLFSVGMFFTFYWIV